MYDINIRLEITTHARILAELDVKIGHPPSVCTRLLHPLDNELFLGIFKFYDIVLLAIMLSAVYFFAQNSAVG